MDLALNPIAICHAPVLQRLFCDPNVTRYLSGFDDPSDPFDLERAVSFCERATLDNEDGIAMHRIIRYEKAIVGYIGLRLRFLSRWGTADLEYWLGSRYFGLGIMPQAIRLITQVAFLEHPHLQRIQCSIASDNHASRRAAEKAGLMYEATLRRSLFIHDGMVDECVYAYLREPETFNR